MAKKVYAVKNGRRTGIFDTWPECEAQVIGFPGAQYKSFKAREEARAYLENRGPKAPAEAPQPIPDPAALGDNEAIIYTDGSYFKDRPEEFASASVTLGRGGILAKLARHYTDPEMAKMNNVAGEVMAAALALEEANWNGIRKVTVCHDYKGIAYWVDPDPKFGKPWAAGNRYTKQYRDTVLRLRGEGMEIRFVHTKGHSGIEYNEMVDGMAKQAFDPDGERTPDYPDILAVEQRFLG